MQEPTKDNEENNEENGGLEDQTDEDEMNFSLPMKKKKKKKKVGVEEQCYHVNILQL